MTAFFLYRRRKRKERLEQVRGVRKWARRGQHKAHIPTAEEKSMVRGIFNLDKAHDLPDAGAPAAGEAKPAAEATLAV